MPVEGFTTITVPVRVRDQLSRLQKRVVRRGLRAIPPDVKLNAVSLSALLAAAVDLLAKRIP